MNRPIPVTAIITTYDRPQLVRRAINSVLAQTYEQPEIIVVEDGSATNVKQWLKEKQLSHIRYICHESNKGLAAARNTGLSMANGEYIAYLDDDDEWKSNRLEKQISLLEELTAEEKSQLGVIYCGVEKRSPDGSIIRTLHPKNQGDLKASIIQEGISTLSSTFLFSKRSLEEIGGFDEKLPSSIDDDIWMALASHGYSAFAVDEPLVVVYESHNRARMLNSTDKRIQGVRAFVEKWRPIYESWLGETQGRNYSHRYFARVVALLAANKIVAGEFSEAGQAIRKIFEYSEATFYNISTLVKYAFILSARRFLHIDVVEWQRKTKQTNGAALF